MLNCLNRFLCRLCFLNIRYCVLKDLNFFGLVDFATLACDLLCLILYMSRPVTELICMGEDGRARSGWLRTTGDTRMMTRDRRRAGRSGPKQFRLRKAAAEDKRKEVEDRVLSYAKVKAAEFTANKISGLDVKTREDYLGRFDVKVRNICIWIFRFLWFLLSWPLNTVNNINLSLSFVQCCVSWMIYSESGYGYEFFEFFLSYPCYLSVFGTLSIKKNNTNYLQLSVIFYFTTVQSRIHRPARKTRIKILIYLLFLFFLDPAPGKSSGSGSGKCFGSDRIRIHNNGFYESTYFLSFSV